LREAVRPESRLPTFLRRELDSTPGRVVAVLRVAVVMPAYNEEGLPEFIREIDCELRPRCGGIAYVVIDDCSQTKLEESLSLVRCELDITVVRNLVNRGHGPSAISAYRHGLLTGAEVVLHVDGDGQFHGRDLRRVFEALDGSHVAHGVRHSRTDPWFRRAISLVARRVVRGRLRRGDDVNTPLRAYRAETIEGLLEWVPPDAAVPHLVLSVLEEQAELDVARVDVEHRVRRGTDATGTMWPRHRWAAIFPSRRLLAFAWAARLEVRTARRGGPLRDRPDTRPVIQAVDLTA
jgi:dolichol-phosphate mannosyltransferase